MALSSKYLFIASMDVDAEKGDLFNEVYNTEHCPLLSNVPGVVSVSRFETQPLTMVMGGETRTIVWRTSRGERAEISRPVRTGGPVGPDQQGVGRGRGQRPVAGPGQAVYE